MYKPHGGLRFVVAFVVCALLVLATQAAADTIYLKNGRIIRSSAVRIEGDRVIFLQYGGEVTIPLSLVDRIEEDESRGPEARPTSRPAPDTADTSGDPGATGDPDDPSQADQEDPRLQREYWQDALRTIVAEREQLNTRMEELRREERAFLFSQRSTAETRRRIEDTEARLGELDEEEAELREEARRLGIPAGWLRLDPGSGGGG